jgi:hypothetical protein
MKSIALFGVFLLSSIAHAANKYLCCDLPAGESSVACLGSSVSCAPKATYSLEVWDLDVDPSSVPWVNPLALEGSFPDGVDGYMYWSTELPFFGYCLVAPSSSDPMHIGHSDPIGCFRVTLNPGISGEGVHVTVPVDERWNGFMFCYGAADALKSCKSINDGLDDTVTETDESGS